MEREKHVDESWKDDVSEEKSRLSGQARQEPASNSNRDDSSPQPETPDGSFINYISSLAFQAMIFLGDIPNPMNDNKTEKNMPQAKFLIDTLLMMREKTKGNLSPQEEELLTNSIYELQLRYVEQLKAGEKTG